MFKKLFGYLKNKISLRQPKYTYLFENVNEKIVKLIVKDEMGKVVNEVNMAVWVDFSKQSKTN